MLGQLVMVGISHARSEQALLEGTSVRPADVPAFLDELRAAGYEETVALSTCSRTELYAVTGAGRTGPAGLIDLLFGRVGPDRAAAESAVEVRSGSEAIGHLFRVTAGLESRVVGETFQPDVDRAPRERAVQLSELGLGVRSLRAAQRGGKEPLEQWSCRARDLGCTEGALHLDLDVGLAHNP